MRLFGSFSTFLALSCMHSGVFVTAFEGTVCYTSYCLQNVVSVHVVFLMFPLQQSPRVPMLCVESDSAAEIISPNDRNYILQQKSSFVCLTGAAGRRRGNSLIASADSACRSSDVWPVDHLTRSVFSSPCLWLKNLYWWLVCPVPHPSVDNALRTCGGFTPFYPVCCLVSIYLFLKAVVIMHEVSHAQHVVDHLTSTVIILNQPGKPDI